MNKEQLKTALCKEYLRCLALEEVYRRIQPSDATPVDLVSDDLIDLALPHYFVNNADFMACLDCVCHETGIEPEFFGPMQMHLEVMANG